MQGTVTLTLGYTKSNEIVTPPKSETRDGST